MQSCKKVKNITSPAHCLRVASKLSSIMTANVLILGGVGFIGRTLAAMLIEENLAASVRVADKVIPATAYLSERHKKVFENPKLDFKQANLGNAGNFHV
jgi:nucleoside-diphosphate-sugar epimerase